MDTLTFVLSALANLLGSLGGVSLAFYLERRRDKSQSVETYLERLYACHHELDILREQFESTRDRLRPGEAAVSSFEAPLLLTLLNSPGIQRHSSYGIIVCVASLSSHLKLVENEMQYFRSAASMGRLTTGPDVAYIISELNTGARVTKYVQNVLLEELKRLKHSEKRTARDDELVDGLLKAARGETPTTK